MDIKATFASRLKALREERGINQEDLGDAIGVSRGSISFYEKSERSPDIITLQGLTKYFEVSADYLIGNHKEKSADLYVGSICEKLSLSEITVEHLMKNDYIRVFIEMLVRDDCLWTKGGDSSTIRFLLEYLQYGKSVDRKAKFTLSKAKNTKETISFGGDAIFKNLISEIRYFTDEDILATYLLKSQQRLAKLKESVEEHMPEYLEENE